MNAKRIFAFLLITAMAMSTSACKSGESETTADTTATTATETLTDAATEDTDAVPETAKPYVLEDGTVIYDPAVDYTNVSYSEGLDENGHFADVKASDAVTFNIDTDSFTIPMAGLDLSEEAINNDVLELIKVYPSILEEDSPREIADGDIVKLTYSATIDGKRFSGSTAYSDKVIVLGTDDLFGDSLDCLVGHKPGDVLSVDIVIGENTDLGDLIGKTANTEITVKAIMKMPDENELAVAAGFADAAVMRQELIDYRRGYYIFDSFKSVIAEASCESIPGSVIKQLASDDLIYFSKYAATAGLTLDECLKGEYGVADTTEFLDASMSAYEENAVKYLAAQALAEKYGVTVSEDEVRATYSADDIEEYGIPYLKRFSLFQTKLPAYFTDENA